MGRSYKNILSFILIFSFAGIAAFSQNYRDQKKLIRLKPNNLIVFGNIQTPDEEPLRGAEISLFNPSTARIVETIRVDDMGDYLFTLEKGRTFGLIVEQEGLFPYYTQFIVPTDLEEEWDNPIELPKGLRNSYRLIFSYGSFSPTNGEELEELIGAMAAFPDLNIWMPDPQDDIAAERRDSVIAGIMEEEEIDEYRILTGPPPAEQERFITVLIVDDGIVPEEGNLGEIQGEEEGYEGEERGIKGEVEGNLGKEEVVSEKWTVQFVASKRKLSDSDLKGINGVRVFEGKDGYFRYTFGIWNSKEEADKQKAFLRSKGFGQAFAKKIADLEKL